mgnify:FL=1
MSLLLLTTFGFGYLETLGYTKNGNIIWAQVIVDRHLSIYSFW